MSARRSLGWVAALALTVSGCGVSSWVTAPESKYPISMSPGIRDQTGELVPASQKSVVGTYDKDYQACSMLWRIVSFTGDKDISDDINEKVKKAGGDAVTNFSVESSGTVWNMLTFLGIFPDCANVKLHGDIVKVVAAAPAPAPAAAPPAAAPPATPTPAAAPAPAAAASAPTAAVTAAR